jgi:hypothetical protein
MYNDIRNHFVELFKNQDVRCHEGFRLPNRVNGELDMRVNSTIVDYKVSCEDGVKAEWTLQLLCYAYMCAEKGVNIDTIQIFNPLKGVLHTGSISDWIKEKKGAQLVDYLLAKNEAIKNRTKNKETDMIKKKEDIPKYTPAIEIKDPEPILFFRPYDKPANANQPKQMANTGPNMMRLRF